MVQIFQFQQAYFILDELLLAGELQESSKKNILRSISQQDSLEGMEVSAELSRDFIYLPVPTKGYTLSCCIFFGVSGHFRFSPFSSLTQIFPFSGRRRSYETHVRNEAGHVQH
jgi:hypothetical protein